MFVFSASLESLNLLSETPLPLTSSLFYLMFANIHSKKVWGIVEGISDYLNTSFKGQKL